MTRSRTATPEAPYSAAFGPSTPADRETTATTGLVTLLLALNFATALPPVATIFSPTAAQPRVFPAAHPIVNPIGLQAVLGRPLADVGRGLVALGDIDARLDGLIAALDVYRLVGGANALVTVSVVRPASELRLPGAGLDASASTADLWNLARAALVEHQVTCAAPGLSGDDAFLADYGRTAQVAWLVGGRLLTTSVTCLDDAPSWRLDAVRAIARYVDAYRAYEEMIRCPGVACRFNRSDARAQQFS